MLYVGDMLEPKYGKFRNNFSQCDDNVPFFPQKQPLYLSQVLFFFVARMWNFAKKETLTWTKLVCLRWYQTHSSTYYHSAISHIYIQGIPCTKFTILSKIGPFLRRAFCPALASTTLPENFLGGFLPWEALMTDWVHKCCITVFGVLFCKDICSSWECFSLQAHSRSSIHKTNAS